MKDSRYQISVQVQRPQDVAPMTIQATDPANGADCNWTLPDANAYIRDQTLTAPTGTKFVITVEVMPGG